MRTPQTASTSMPRVTPTAMPTTLLLPCTSKYQTAECLNFQETSYYYLYNSCHNAHELTEHINIYGHKYTPVLLIMAALRNRAGHYIFALWFLSFFLLFFLA